ncbi:polyphosphate polymerase domain-containing protein [Brevibacillus daliensis]|uniref:polyphosphate polymerase domain-containing protein n=1 Tax=Brevibacillus daliensis TaxID=2892995 RepID=UPI001E3CFFC4|nr:polyphosphate polymerase domain-containing protein [Brevibacillus daliensis]
MNNTGINTFKGRVELKHEITAMDCFLLRHNLQHIMKSDPHANNNGTYVIRSVYFDNIDDKVVTEKKEGFYKRDKYRVRLYDHNTEYMNLEKKSKRNDLCQKQKCRITKEEYERIRHDDIGWMEEDERDLIRELYVQMNLFQLKPITIVDYKREAFIYEYGNVRVTFDSSIKTSFRNNDLLNPDITMIDILEPNMVVLEVKYDEYLPDVIRKMLQVSDRRKNAFSKYQVSRMFG